MAYTLGDAARATGKSKPTIAKAINGKIVLEVPRAWSKDGRLRLQARALKVTLVIDPAVLAGLDVPIGKPHVPFVIDVGGRRVTGRFTAKSLRKAVAAVAERGVESVAVVVQAKLAVGDKLEETGIVAQPKAMRVAKED